MSEQDKGGTWDMNNLAQQVSANRAAENLATMVAHFHNRLVERGMTGEDAADLCHTFLGTYITCSFESSQNKP